MSNKTEYYLCNDEVVRHFPDLEKSNPFKSGYEWDNDDYYVIATNDFGEISNYYKKVIEPFNRASNAPIEFWANECCGSQLNADKITLKLCKEIGLFRAIEQVLCLTKECNRAYAIYSMSNRFGITPIELINKIYKSKSSK